MESTTPDPAARALRARFRLRLLLAGLAALLSAPPAPAARGFEPPARVVENQEGPLAPFVLYPPLRLASVPGTGSAVLLWTEKRFGRNPFEVDLLARVYEAAAWGPEQYLFSLREQPLPEGAAVWAEGPERLHLAYGTRVEGEGRLVHRLVDLSLQGGAETVLDRGPGYLGQPALCSGELGLAVAYLRDGDLALLEPASHAAPRIVVSGVRPVDFDLACTGASLFLAVARSVPDELRASLAARVELVELRASGVVERRLVADPGAPVAEVTVAASPEGRLAVVWVDDRHSTPRLPNPEIYGRLREPGGRWLPEERLTRLQGHSVRPALVWDGEERLHLLWQDDVGGSFEVYHRVLGETAIEAVSARDEAPSFTPRAAWVGGRLLVAWRDGVEGRADLYFSFAPAAETEGRD